MCVRWEPGRKEIILERHKKALIKKILQLKISFMIYKLEELTIEFRDLASKQTYNDDKINQK
jgi:hypothetical protein